MSKTIRLELKDIQKPVTDIMKAHAISIITGDAGTGKDFMCLHTALTYITDKKSGYDKIILAKPIVESGKSMGALPGDVGDKVGPYRASMDAIIIELLPKEGKRQELIKKQITFEPVNFVRGNTFKNAIAILSEAQNCTLHELMTFVTRLDSTSKMFLNGDEYQSDIGKRSGLKDLISITKDIKEIAHVELGDEHQMRSPLIVELSKKYKEFLNKK